MVSLTLIELQRRADTPPKKHVARAETLRVEALFKFVGRHANITEDFAQGARGERAVPMHRHNGIDLAARQHMMAAPNTHNDETLALEKA